MAPSIQNVVPRRIKLRMTKTKDGNVPQPALIHLAPSTRFETDIIIAGVRWPNVSTLASN